MLDSLLSHLHPRERGSSAGSFMVWLGNVFFLLPERGIWTVLQLSATAVPPLAFLDLNYSTALHPDSTTAWFSSKMALPKPADLLVTACLASDMGKKTLGVCCCA